MALLPTALPLGFVLLLLWLHLCGCGGYHDDDADRALDSTAHHAFFLEESATPPAKRQPRSEAPGGGRGGEERHDGAADNRVRPTSVRQPTATQRSYRRSRVGGENQGVFPASAKVCVGEDVIYRLWGAPGLLKNCSVVTAKKARIQLHPPASNNSDSRIEYFDSGLDGERCGFRIRGVRTADYGMWLLTAVTNEANVSSKAGVSVAQCSANGTETHSAHLAGESAASQCGPPSVRACYVAPPGESGDPNAAPAAVQVRSCQTPGLNFSNLVAGEWTCSWACEGSMLQRTSKVDIEYAKLPSDQDVGLTWRNESLDGRKPSVDLRCNYLGNSIVTLCKFTRPGNGGALYPSDGLAHGRYSYSGRGVINGDCGLSVELPLAQEDLGVWRCEVYFNPTADPWVLRGGFIEVGIPKRTREEKMRTLRPWEEEGRRRNGTGFVGGVAVEEAGVAAIEVMAGDPLVLGCSADAPLTLCLIRSPDGDASRPPGAQGGAREGAQGGVGKAHGRGERLGDCGLRLQSANANHTGRWECVVGIDYGDAHVVPIWVLVHDRPLVAEVEGEMSLGQPAEFRCRSVTGVALEHCRFERPDRSIVTVMDSRHPDAHRATWAHGVRAVGDLGTGVCAVSVPALRGEDLGEWRCVAKAEDSAEELRLRFRVDERGISVASVGTISAAVVIVVVAALVLGAVCYRRHARRRGYISEPSNQGAASGESVISFRRGVGDEDADSQTS